MRKHHRPTLAGVLAVLVLAACGALPNDRSFGRDPLLDREPSRDYDVQHYAIDVVLYPERRSIDGSCRIDLAPRGAGVEEIALDLVGLQVRGVRDESGRSLAFRHADGVLAVDLGEPLDAPRSITVDYGGRPITGLWYSGTGADGQSPSQVFTQGQPEHSRGWFPCYDHPSDRASHELRVTMPADWTGVMPGTRIDLEEAGATRTEHWRMDFEHPSYLVSLVAGEFVVQEASWNGVPLVFAAEPQYRDWLEASFHETDEILTFLSDYTGVTYPYAKYSQVCVANFPWGGMENISATTLTPLTLGDERRIRDQESTGLVAHEAAHQWFGNLFTCNDWPHIWLNEGFATYLTALYLEETRGVDEFRVWMRQAQDENLAEDRGANRRPTVSDDYQEPEELMDTRAYQGAAARLHLLRHLLGDDVFRAGVRTYVAENAGRNVVTQDLQRALEKVSGRKLDRFFQQWIHGAGHPEFQIDWRYDERSERVLLDVRQVQASRGTASVFQLPVEVEVRDEHGTVVHRVDLVKRNHRFEFPVSGRPLSVRFDHGGWIPKTVTQDKSISEWLVIAHEDTDVNGRRDAVRTLGRLAADALERNRIDTHETIVAELVHRLAKDRSRHVRADAATALGVARGLEARERLIVAARADDSAKVRSHALSALARFGPSPELATVAERAFQTGYSYETMASAAELFTSAAPDRAYAWLTQKLFVDSPHDVLRAALLEDLGGLRNYAVLEQLRRWANDDSTDPTARAVALRQIAKQSREPLVNSRFVAGFLEAEDFRLRQAALESLAAIDEEIARRALKAYYPTARTSSERRVIEAVLARTGR